MANELLNGCTVCGPDSPHTDHKVAETMFRTGDAFTYRECRDCGTVQIAAVPDDLARHYGSDYYSFQMPGGRLSHPALRNRLGRTAVRANTELYLRTGKGWGIDWSRTAGMRPSESILDLGCGGGEHVKHLHNFGFRHLVGADPFLDADREVALGVPLYRRRHYEVDGQFDWVMLHHTFEHIPDPRATLASVARVLAPGGRVLLRLPLAGGWAWRMYGADWVQLDAPRHLVLYSLPGLRRLAEAEGFDVELVVFDSTGFQVWGSELVRHGIPHNRGPVGFDRSQLAAWDNKADQLNRALDGDQAVIVLRPAR